MHIAHLLCTNFWYFFFSSGDPKKFFSFGDPEISLSSPPLVLENGKWRSGQFWKIWVFQMWFIYSCSINCIYQISIFSSFLYWANVHNTRHAVRAILQIRCRRRCRSNLFVISSLSWSGKYWSEFFESFRHILVWRRGTAKCRISQFWQSLHISAQTNFLQKYQRHHKHNSMHCINICCSSQKSERKIDYDITGCTGWSKETVDCNFLLTDPKISKSIITHWFLESLYREGLVFWCFNGVRCVEFCLFKHFQYRAFSAPYKAWTIQNTLTHIQTP